MIRNLVINLRKDAQSGASNQRMFVNSGHEEPKEGNTVYQLLEGMEIGKHESMPTNMGFEEATSRHIF
jgi:hypothetical protein